MRDFDLGLPQRRSGLTHVIDKGLGPRGWEDVLEVAGELIDVVKLGWGTAYVSANLRRKLDVLKEKPVVLGGTFFEVVYVKDRLDDYKRWLGELGLTHVEISDGTVEIPRERKLELVADFARDFTVLSEVGSKDSSVEYSAAEWTGWLRGRAGRGRVEGDHRGARGRHRRDLRRRWRDADGADRRDRRRGRDRERDLRGAVEGGSGLVREAVRARGQPRQHPARGSDSARDAASWAARRHARGDPAR